MAPRLAAAQYLSRIAQKIQTIVTLTDDLDGSKADRTIQFGYDGTAYEIDLGKEWSWPEVMDT